MVYELVLVEEPFESLYDERD